MKLSRKQFLTSLAAGLAGLGAIAMGKGAEQSIYSLKPLKKHMYELGNISTGDAKNITYTTVNKMGEKWRRNQKLYYGAPPHESLYKIHIDAEKLMREITG